MLDRIVSILAQYTETQEITEASTLQADLGLSSFDVVEIVTEFEDTFGIEILDRDIPKFVCVGDIVKYLKERV